jgi:hypothetical protein
VCDPVEILVKIRNSLVIRVNREVGISNLGTYLFAFDALYTIWCAKERIEKERLIPLAPTTLGRAGRAAVKLAITIASFGTVHYLGSLADAAGILREIASEAEGAVDIGREVVVDGIFERKTDDVQRFVHRFVAPRLSPRLRSAIGGRVLRSRDIWTFMLDILVDTIILVQKDLVKHGLFMLIADAIDEADDDDKNSIELRFVIGQLTVFLRTHSVATILSGRGPLRYWMEEFQGEPVREEKLEEIPNDDIRRTFVQAGLDAAAIEEVLASAKSREATSAGALSEACKRLAIEWSVRAGF